MTRTLRQIALLASKDIKLEARSRQTVGLVVILGILIVAVLGLGLGPGTAAQGVGATAILWVAYLFGGVLCFEKTMSVERYDEALSGLLLAPVDRGAIFAGKLLSNLALMIGLAIVVTPVGMLLFNFDLSAAPVGFAVIILLSMIGFAAVGTLFSALVSSTRLQGGLLAMLVFPINLPLVLTSTRILASLFEEGGSLELSSVAILIAFDAIFLVASWIMFEVVLEA